MKDPNLWLPLLLLASALLLYAPIIDGEFVFDDVRLVEKNDWLWQEWQGIGAEVAMWGSLLTEVGDPREADEVRVGFRPVRFISYRIDALMTMATTSVGSDPRSRTTWFHLQNVLWHAFAAWMVMLLTRRLFPSAGFLTAFFVSMAFLFHPVQTEAVAYISGRRDVLFCAFYLWALVVAAGGAASPSWRRGVGVAALALLSLLSKEMAATLPAVLLVMLFFQGKGTSAPGDRGQALKLILPATGVVVVFVFLLLTTQNPGAGAPWWGGSPSNAFWTSMRGICGYISLLLWPVGLTVDYSHGAFLPSSGPVDPIGGVLSLAIVCLLVAGSLLAYRRGHRPLALAFPLFIVLLSPVLQAVPHPERFAERFLYLPMVAFLLGLGALGARWVRSRPATISAFTVVLIVWGGLTASRLEEWRTPYSLWRSATIASPDCARAWFGLGNAAAGIGRPVEASNAFGKAVASLDELAARDALQQGIYLQALQMRAGLLASSGNQKDLEIAATLFDALLEQEDTDGTPVREQPFLLLEAMKVAERLGSRDQAVAHAEALRVLEAPSALKLEALLYLGGASQAEGEAEAAAEFLDEARALARLPGERARIEYQEGMHRLLEEDWHRALAAFRLSLERLGSSGRRASAQYRIAECLLHLQRPTDARVALEALIEEDPEHLPAQLSLGELELGEGDLDRAEECFRLVLARDSREPRAIQGIRQVLVARRIREGPPLDSPDPTRVTVLLLLADKLEGEGELDKAHEALVEAEKEAEGLVEKERRIELRWRIARLAVRRQQLPVARQWYEKFRTISEVKDRGQAAVEAAEVERRLEGEAAALDLLQKEASEGVEHPLLLRNLGALSEQLSKDDDALHWYRKYLQMPGLTPMEKQQVLSSIERIEARR